MAEKASPFRKRAFPIIYDDPAYRIGLNDYYIFDFEATGQMITREVLENGKIIKEGKSKWTFVPMSQVVLESELDKSEKVKSALMALDLIANEEVVNKMLKSAEIKRNWVDIAMGALTCGGVCLFIGLALGLSGWF